MKDGLFNNIIHGRLPRPDNLRYRPAPCPPIAPEHHGHSFYNREIPSGFPGSASAHEKGVLRTGSEADSYVRGYGWTADRRRQDQYANPGSSNYVTPPYAHGKRARCKPAVYVRKAPIIYSKPRCKPRHATAYGGETQHDHPTYQSYQPCQPPRQPRPASYLDEYKRYPMKESKSMSYHHNHNDHHDDRCELRHVKHKPRHDDCHYEPHHHEFCDHPHHQHHHAFPDCRIPSTPHKPDGGHYPPYNPFIPGWGQPCWARQGHHDRDHGHGFDRDHDYGYCNCRNDHHDHCEHGCRDWDCHDHHPDHPHHPQPPHHPGDDRNCNHIIALGLPSIVLCSHDYTQLRFPQQSFGTHSDDVALSRDNYHFQIVRRGVYEVAFQFQAPNTLATDEMEKPPIVVLSVNDVPVQYVEAKDPNAIYQSDVWRHCLLAGDSLCLAAKGGYSIGNDIQSLLTNYAIMIRRVGDC